MKRGGFTKPAPKMAKQCDYTPRPRQAVLRIPDGKDRMCVPVPKEDAVRSEAYRRLVAAMPCCLCGEPAPSQAAHADFGKGTGIKTDDRTCYALCATKYDRPGCHDLIGAGGFFNKESRREFEANNGRKTRLTITSNGDWPKGVPMWPISR